MPKPKEAIPSRYVQLLHASLAPVNKFAPLRVAFKICKKQLAEDASAGECKDMNDQKKTYRSDRRNATRAAGSLVLWRSRPRIRSALWGWRKNKESGELFKVYTFIVGAA